MSCERKRTPLEESSRSFLSKIFCSDEIDIPCDYEIKHMEDGSWIKENYGYYSYGAYRRRTEITPISVIQSVNGRRMTDRVDCRVTQLRSVKIYKCRKCGDVREDYSELPLGK